jgi:ElaB/YqjD/DUF883 family membrane-anchored ribosome-binding protein
MRARRAQPAVARPLLEGRAMMEERSKSEMNGGQLNGHAVPKVMRQVKRADDKLIAFVEERPIVALGVAVAVGYMVGRLFSRRG